MLWEKRKNYSSNKEQLLDTGLCYFGGKLLKLSINHYRYDWPNQPWNKVINIYIPRAENISSKTLNFIGIDIFDLSLSFSNGIISLALSTHEIPPKQSEVTLKDCETEIICRCKRLIIKEKIS